MKKEEVEMIAEILKTKLVLTEKMWDEKVSHAMIIGYLQGTIRGVIEHLETNLK
jgi:hypothetical protein